MLVTSPYIKKYYYKYNFKSIENIALLPEVDSVVAGPFTIQYVLKNKYSN